MFRLIIPVGTSRASWAVSRRTFNWSCWWLILSSSLMISRLTFSTAWFNSFVFSIKLESTHFTDSVPFSKMKRSCHKYILFVYNFQFQASMIELSYLIALQYTWKKTGRWLLLHQGLLTFALCFCIILLTNCWHIMLFVMCSKLPFLKVSNCSRSCTVSSIIEILFSINQSDRRRLITKNISCLFGYF